MEHTFDSPGETSERHGEDVLSGGGSEMAEHNLSQNNREVNENGGNDSNSQEEVLNPELMKHNSETPCETSLNLEVMEHEFASAVETSELHEQDVLSGGGSEIDNVNTNVFLQELHSTKLKFSKPDTEVFDIKTAVDEMVSKIATRIAQINPAFDISHKYLVGSMAEGTSIEEPNEFDYILVLKHLSIAENISVSTMEMEDGGCYAEPIDFNTCECITPKRNEYKLFHAHVLPANEHIKAMFDFCVKGGIFYNKDLNETFKKTVYVVLKEMESQPIKHESGELMRPSYKLVLSDGSACTFDLRWKSSNRVDNTLNISIDLVPAIEQSGVANIVLPDQLDHDLAQFNGELLSYDKYLIVPGKLAHKCFNYTFTNTEVILVRQLSEQHRLCYKVLKYCLRFSFDSSSLFPSYEIKTCVLRHAVSCADVTNLVKCINFIFNKMLSSFGNPFTLKGLEQRHKDIRCIFMTSNFISTTLYDRQELRGINKGLNGILNILKEIQLSETTPSYSFAKTLKRLDDFIK